MHWLKFEFVTFDKNNINKVNTKMLARTFKNFASLSKIASYSFASQKIKVEGRVADLDGD